MKSDIIEFEKAKYTLMAERGEELYRLFKEGIDLIVGEKKKGQSPDSIKVRYERYVEIDLLSKSLGISRSEPISLMGVKLVPTKMNEDFSL